jgi:hypothetical protein
MTPPGSDLDLLGTARAIQRAAVSDDLDRLHVELSRLRTALVEYLHATGDGTHLSDTTHQVVRQGLERLLRFTDDLIFVTAEHDVDCTCLVRAAELQSLLTRQARLEAHLTRSPSSGTS